MKLLRQIKYLFRQPYFYLLLILVLGFVLRMYRIDNAIADWHSWRQADTAAVSREFYEHGFNPFLPKYEDMWDVSGKGANLDRYRFVEFPIYNTLVYLAYLTSGGVNAETARMVTVVISLGSVIFMYLLTKRYFGVKVGLLAALIFAALPYNIFYSRVVLPDPLMVFFSLGSLYFIDRWIFENKRFQFVIGVAFAMLALLAKPMALFLLLPLVYSVFRRENKIFPFRLRYVVFLALAILPLIGWRLWMSRYPLGIPPSGWLLNGNGIRFHPAFFRWIVGDRFDREILTAGGIVLLVLGGLKRPGAKAGYLLHWLLASSLLYLVVFATGNVQHDYYQILIIPALAVFVARGMAVLFEGNVYLLPRIWTIPLALFLFGLMLFLGWDAVKGLYQINNNAIVVAGEEAARILPKNAVVVAPYDGDTAFLYQTDRPGFAMIVNSIDYMIHSYGVTSYVSVSYDFDTRSVMQRFQVLEATPQYVIVDLTRSSPQKQ